LRRSFLSPLGELFKFVMDGTVKVEIPKYPLADAITVHALFEGRKTSGKLVLVPEDTDFSGPTTRSSRSEGSL
jgi:NADPH:quinone reductase-like Zn-dependent oxidoreductase